VFQEVLRTAWINKKNMFQAMGPA